MTILASYDDVVNECQDWLFGRSDIAPKVPTFIRLLEAKANRTLMCRQMETRATGSVNLSSAAPEFVSLPLDYQTMRRVRLLDVQGKPTLSFMTPVQLAQKRVEIGDEAGTPEWFTVIGDEMELLPTPNTANQLEMVYRCNLPALSEANPQNWLLNAAPDFYLFGTLVQAAPYLHEDERIPVWKSALTDAVNELNLLSEKAEFSAGPLTRRRIGRAY